MLRSVLSSQPLARRAVRPRYAYSTASPAKDELPPLPLLQKPLGVKEQPTTVAKTWEERRADLLNQEKRLEQRKHLVKEATKGYFHDLNATRKYGGKTWIAPSKMIRQEAALYFPDIVGKTLDNGTPAHTTHLCQGKVSVISMLSTKMSEVQTASVVDLTNKAFLSNQNYRFVQINLQENVLKSLVVSMFLTSLRRTIPAKLQPTYLVSGQNMEYVRENLGMVNKHIGYVYLLDEHLKVRWAACGDGKLEEADALRTCVGVLLNRLENAAKS